jgi:hypothetical protein
MLTEFGPNGCTLGLGFLSDNTGITLQIVGAVSNTIYIDELLPAVEGISCNINDTSDTTVTITLTGTNVAGQLSLVTGPAASQPVPYAAPIVAADTATPANTAQTGGTAASYSRSDHAHGAILSDTATLASAAQTGGVATDYSRSDHAHGAILSDTATLASAAQTGGVATDYSRSDHAHGFANPNLLYNSTGEKGPGSIANLIDGWTANGGVWSSLLPVDNNTVEYFNLGAPALIYDQGNSGLTVELVSNSIECSSGEVFTLSGLIWTPDSSGYMAIQTFDGTSWTTLAPTVTVTSSEPTFVSVTGTIPNASQCRVVLYSNEITTSPTKVLFALVKLESGSFATPWVPSVVAQPWTPYTPVIGGTGWVLGNGSVAGSFRVIDAKTMMVNLQFTTGSTTVVGSGSLTLGLPGSISNEGADLYGKMTFNGVGATIALGDINPGGYVYPIIPSSPSSASELVNMNSSLSIPSGSILLLRGIVEVA